MDEIPFVLVVVVFQSVSTENAYSAQMTLEISTLRTSPRMEVPLPRPGVVNHLEHSRYFILSDYVINKT